MRKLDFADGFTATAAPTTGVLSATELQKFESVGAYLTNKGESATQGDIFFCTTDNLIYYYTTQWENIASLSDLEALAESLGAEKADVTTVAAIEERVTEAEGDIDDLEATTSTQATQIADLESTKEDKTVVTAIDTRLTAAESDISDLQDSHDDLAYTLTTKADAADLLINT